MRRRRREIMMMEMMMRRRMISRNIRITLMMMRTGETERRAVDGDKEDRER